MLIVGGCMKDNVGLGNDRISTQLTNELEAIHFGHEEVGNDQLRPFGARFLQSFGAITGRDHAVAIVLKHCRQEFSVTSVVVDNQNGGHGCSPIVLWQKTTGPSLGIYVQA